MIKIRNIKGDNIKMWKPYNLYINDKITVDGISPTTFQDGVIETRFQRVLNYIKDGNYGKLSHIVKVNGIIKVYMVK